MSRVSRPGGVLPHSSDVLSAIFEAAKIRATTTAIHRLRAPFVQDFDGMLVQQHRIVRGQCRLRVDDSVDVFDLKAGDFLLLTRRQSHTLTNVGDGPDSAEVVVASGSFGRSGSSADALFGLLPPVLHVNAAAQADGVMLSDALRVVDEPSSAMASEAIAARVAELMFLLSIRRQVTETLPTERWAASAFQDPHLFRALRAMHSQPTRRWTAASLARHAGMARSTFAEHFALVVGEPPGAYLTRLRMQMAVKSLRAGASLAEVALEVGYTSEGAFSKAFKRWLGVSPSSYRAATAHARRRARKAPMSAVGHASAGDSSGQGQTRLSRIATDLEELIPSVFCAIMRFAPTDGTLRHGAAPSLPDIYNRAIDGVRIGPSVGSCGTAVFRREPVMVQDIATSELWADFRYLAERFHLRSCWSRPILDKCGEVLGTFSIYRRHQHVPTDVEIAIADRMAERVRAVLTSEFA